MTDETLARELSAIEGIIAALEGFDKESQQRIIDFVIDRTGLASPTVGSRIVQTTFPQPPVQDILTLTTEKKPRYATQMAAVVAYYLSEVAPIEERKTAIEHDDIKTYFKQARFRLPKSIKDVLIHATQAGYFDYLGGNKYKLNPVGYNLVVHALPEKKKPT